jgi:hypothetical protein
MFQLDSILTIWLFAIISIISNLAVVIFWEKFARKSFLNFIFRLLALILCQILVLATVGLSINRSNGFYSSWGDLLGNGATYSSEVVVPKSGLTLDSSFLKGAEKSENGQVIINEVVQGKKSGISNVVYLILPRSAVSNIKKGKPIDLSNTKVVEFLSGYPSQPVTWFRSLDIARALAESERANPGKSIIGVIPAVNVAGVKDLECMNFPNGGVQTETWLSTDLRTIVNTQLGLPPQRWGLMGVSTGGWCSAMLSIKHEDLFYGAVSIAGYYRPALVKTTDPSVKAQLDNDYDFAKLEASMTGKTDMLIIASVGDSYSYRETNKFRALVHPKINYQYIELASGGHNPRVWISQLGGALNWLKQH